MTSNKKNLYKKPKITTKKINVSFFNPFSESELLAGCWCPCGVYCANGSICFGDPCIGETCGC